MRNQLKKQRNSKKNEELNFIQNKNEFKRIEMVSKRWIEGEFIKRKWNRWDPWKEEEEEEKKWLIQKKNWNQ